MSQQQRRGQRIYLLGKSASGKEIMAYLNNTVGQLPASLLPCVNCHQYNGEGIHEGGIKPSDIRWSNLTKAYGPSKASAESHPPYNQRSIKKAISMGVGSGGQSLSNSMPRYQLNHQDMSDLVAYLAELGTYRASGISETSISIGVILPGNNKIKSHAIKEVISAYFSNLNQQGGIYQRHIKLLFITSPPNNSKEELDAFEKKLRHGNVFAFVASNLQGIEALMNDYTDRTGVPVIGALSATPHLAFPLNRYIFYLLSGKSRQTLALQSFVEKTHQLKSTATSIALLENTAGFSALTQIFSKRNQNTPRAGVITIDPSTSKQSLKSKLIQQKNNKVNSVYLLISKSMQAIFFNVAEEINWFPIVLIPGSEINPELFSIPLGFDQRTFIALPSLPTDYSSSGLIHYNNLQKENQVTSNYKHSQLLAISAAKLLKEALIKTGYKMEQQKLVAMMESLYQFDTKLTRPVSYGPNRRVGISGAYIVTIDLTRKTVVPVSKWLETPGL